MGLVIGLAILVSVARVVGVAVTDVDIFDVVRDPSGCFIPDKTFSRAGSGKQSHYVAHALEETQDADLTVFSPDNRYLAFWSPRDRKVRLITLGTAEGERIIEVSKARTYFRFSSDSTRLLLYGQTRGTAVVYAIDEAKSYELPVVASAAAFAPFDPHEVVTVSPNRSVMSIRYSDMSTVELLPGTRGGLINHDLMSTAIGERLLLVDVSGTNLLIDAQRSVVWSSGTQETLEQSVMADRIGALIGLVEPADANGILHLTEWRLAEADSTVAPQPCARKLSYEQARGLPRQTGNALIGQSPFAADENALVTDDFAAVVTTSCKVLIVKPRVHTFTFDHEAENDRLLRPLESDDARIRELTAAHLVPLERASVGGLYSLFAYARTRSHATDTRPYTLKTRLAMMRYSVDPVVAAMPFARTEWLAQSSDGIWHARTNRGRMRLFQKDISGCRTLD